MDEDTLKTVQEAIEENLDARMREMAASDSINDLWQKKCELVGARAMAALILKLLVKASRE